MASYLSSTKPLAELMQAYFQLDPEEQTSVAFELIEMQKKILQGTKINMSYLNQCILIQAY